MATYTCWNLSIQFQLIMFNFLILCFNFQRNCAISPIDKLLWTLRFYATGSFLITAGDFLGVSKSSTCIIVRTVSTPIARLCHQFIRMPATDEEVYTLQRCFYKIARFPRAIGAIDCTHIRIQRPGYWLLLTIISNFI